MKTATRGTRRSTDPLKALVRRTVRVIHSEEDANTHLPRRPDHARLVESDVLHRLMPGYYAVVPADQIGNSWTPDLEPTAWGIAAANDSHRSASLMGISAARMHGAIEETMTTAIVATSDNRPTARLTDRKASISFIRRNLPRLLVVQQDTDLGPCWVTTVEQTLLDLATYPQLGGRPDAAHQAIDALLPKADRQLLYNLAVSLRQHGAISRLQQHIQN